MRKATVIIVLILTLCLLVMGCGVGASSVGGKAPDSGKVDKEPVITDSADCYEDTDEGEIKEPVVDWWRLYVDTANKNCVTVQVSNPNSFPVQFSYDLIYYKNNEVVKTESFWAMNCLEPGRPGIIFGDLDIPSSADVDSVTLENVYVTEFPWRTIDSSFTETRTEKEQRYFDVKFPEKPTSSEIWAVLYNDVNGDNSVQAEEFAGMGAFAFFDNIYEQEGELTIPVSDERLSYTDYKIYCTAFVTE